MNKFFLMLSLCLGSSTVSMAHGSQSSLEDGARNGFSDFSFLRRVRVYQRSSAVIDVVKTGSGLRKSMTISVGDVTRNQVLTTASLNANGDLHRTISLRQGNVIKFNFRNSRYRLKLIYLLNKPIGHDYAVFSVEKSTR